MKAWTALVALGLVVGTTSYEDLGREAESVKNLGRLLEGYLEDCSLDVPGFDAEACRNRVKINQRAANKKRHRLEIDDVTGQLSFAGWDKRKNAYRLHLVPVFGERGVALTVGKPKRLDRQGQPVMKNIPIWVKRPDGEPEFIFKKRLERGMVRLELLVEPKRAWRMRRKGEDDLRGMETKLVGLRLYAARGDKVLAEQTYGRR